jgi:hypothetical protein
MDFIDRKITEWRARASEYDRDGAVAQARVYSRLADELEEAMRAWLNEELSVPAAAEYSGYDESAIRKMRSDGRVPASADGRIRRKDLPKKPGHGVHRAAPRLLRGGPDLAGDVVRDLSNASTASTAPSAGRGKP